MKASIFYLTIDYLSNLLFDLLHVQIDVEFCCCIDLRYSNLNSLPYSRRGRLLDHLSPGVYGASTENGVEYYETEGCLKWFLSYRTRCGWETPFKGFDSFHLLDLLF